MYKQISLAVLLLSIIYLASVNAVKTECQVHRERELVGANKFPGRLIPECESNGDYKLKQCHPPSRNNKSFCQCWSNSGEVVTQPSQNLLKCNCLVEAHHAKKRGGVGGFIPQCENDGTYSKQQCHGSTGMCWCANEDGKVLGEKKRGSVKCN